MKRPFTLIGALAFSLAVCAQSQTIEVPIISTGTVTIDGVSIDGSTDDAEQEGDAIDALYDDDLDAGWKSDPEDLLVVTVGLRFQNIAIPQGVTIEEAYLKVNSHEAKTAADAANVTIYGNDVDNAVTFNETDLITDRVKTSASATWTVDTDWGLHTDEQSVDFTAVVQEIVSRDGWASGNALALILQGEDQGVSGVDNCREFESFENIDDPEEGGDGLNHSDRVPVLVVKYNNTPFIASSAAQSSSVVTVSPNPTSRMLNVSGIAAGAELSVVDAAGSVVAQVAAASIDISALPSGIYTLLVKQNGSVSGHTVAKK